MASSLKPCAKCPTLTRGALCHTCRQLPGMGARPPGVNYGRRWKKARLEHLAEHPFCVMCQDEGELTVATDVDHIIPHRGDYTRFWDRANWQSLCRPHHGRKTAQEEAHV